MHLFATGIALAGWGVVSGRFELAALGAAWPSTLGAAGLGLVAVVLAMTPFGVVSHGLGLTPERAGVAVLLFVLLAPFQLALHFLLRRGGTIAATTSSLLGRSAVLVVLQLAVALGMLSSVVSLMLPVLTALFVLFEVVATSIYATSRNTVAPALIEAGWLAWIFAAVLPITL